VIWTTFLACVGFYLGENQDKMHALMSNVGNMVLAIVVIIALCFVFKRYWKKKHFS